MSSFNVVASADIISMPGLLRGRVSLYTRKRHNQKDFFTYILPNAAYSLNLSGGLRTAMLDIIRQAPRELDEKSGKEIPQIDWKNPMWTKHFKSVESEVIELIEYDHIYEGQKFWKSAFFQKYHAIRVKKGSKKADKAAEKSDTGDLADAKLDTKKLQSMLGFTTAKATNTQKFLKEMLVAVNAGDQRTAKKKYQMVQMFEEDSGKKGFVPDTDYKDMVKLLRKHGFLPKKA